MWQLLNNYLRLIVDKSTFIHGNSLLPFQTRKVGKMPGATGYEHVLKGEFTCQIMSSLTTARLSTPTLPEYTLTQLLPVLQPGKIRNRNLLPRSLPGLFPPLLFVCSVSHIIIFFHSYRDSYHVATLSTPFLNIRLKHFRNLYDSFLNYTDFSKFKTDLRHDLDESADE